MTIRTVEGSARWKLKNKTDRIGQNRSQSARRECRTTERHEQVQAKEHSASLARDDGE